MKILSPVIPTSLVKSTDLLESGSIDTAGGSIRAENKHTKSARQLNFILFQIF